MKADFMAINDRERVGCMLRNDHDAWDYVLLTVVMRIVQRRKFSLKREESFRNEWHCSER